MGSYTDELKRTYECLLRRNQLRKERSKARLRALRTESAYKKEILILEAIEREEIAIKGDFAIIFSRSNAQGEST